MVVHACNCNYLGGRGWRFEASPDKKMCVKFHFNKKKLSVMVSACHPSCNWRSRRPALGKNGNPIQKITEAKKGWGHGSSGKAPAFKH
jgi:hypothetical protein